MTADKADSRRVGFGGVMVPLPADKTDSVNQAGYVTMDIAALFRGIRSRLKPEKTSPGYDEGWNDALYLILDVLEGQEPFEPRAADGR